MLEIVRFIRMWRDSSAFRENIAQALIITVHAVCFFVQDNPPFVGEETRIIYHGIAYLLTGNFCIEDKAVWDAWYDSVGTLIHWWGGVDDCHPIGFVLSGILQSPAVYFWGQDGSRALAGLVMMLGSLGLLRLLTRAFGQTGIWLALLAATTIPVIAFSRSAFVEPYLYATICWAWHLITAPAVGKGKRFIGMCLALLLPFLHLRVGLLAPILMGMLVYRSVRDGWPLVKAIGLPALVSAVALGLFCWFQISIYGQVMGGGSVTSWSPWMFFHRLAIHLFDFRHGLIPYIPIAILGLAGIWVGLVRRQLIAIEAASLFLGYVLFSVWAGGGESQTARYWVACIPFVVAAVGVWLTAIGRRPVLWLLAASVLLLHAYLAITYVADSHLYFHNRTFSISYDRLFEQTGFLHLGAYLPLDDYFHGWPDAYLGQMHKALVGFVYLMAFTALMAWAVLTEYRRLRNGLTTFAAGFVCYVLAAHSLVEIPTDGFSVKSGRQEDNRWHYDVTFAQPQRPVLHRIGDVVGEVWFPPRFPRHWALSAASEPEGELMFVSRIPPRIVGDLWNLDRSVVRLRIADFEPRADAFTNQYLGPRTFRFYRHVLAF